MINLKKLRGVLEREIQSQEWLKVDGKYTPSKVISDRITIKRKKKMILVKTNGDVKAKRVNYLKIEIIEGGN